MTLSIVIPVYNKEVFLGRCLDSLLEMESLSYEIILVDDGSTDASFALCKAYQEQHARVRVISQTNQGVSVARNTGMLYAAGEFITFIDADDFVKPSYEMQILQAIQHDADWYLFNYTRWVNENVQAKGRLSLPQGMQSSMSSLTRQVAGLEICVLSTCSGVFRTAIIQEHGIQFRAGMKTCEDFLFNLTYFRCIKNFYVSDGDAYCYRDNPASVTNCRPISHAYDYDVVYQQAKEYLSENDAQQADEALYQERWIRWTLGLVAQWKRQAIPQKEIWSVLRSCAFYTQLLERVPTNSKVKIEYWMLKCQQEGLVLSYLRIMAAIKKGLHRNDL